MEKITKAVIIAAGQGKRLRPVTDNMPKPLVPVNGVRIMDTIIHALRANGIKEIYIIVGYKKEQFSDIYGNDPDIHLIENPYYLEGNNILSLYAARKYLPGAFVIEGDIYVQNEAVFSPETDRSLYCAQWMPTVPEWAVKMVDGCLSLCCIQGDVKDAYRMWGISAWTQEDGKKLADLICEQVEIQKNTAVYWDEIALRVRPDCFHLGIRPVRSGDLTEIDTVKELAEMDSSYLPFC